MEAASLSTSAKTPERSKLSLPPRSIPLGGPVRAVRMV
jgi:hypothetical protein